MQYYTVKEASVILSVSERWIQMMCKRGEIVGALRDNNKGAWRIPQKWVETQCFEANNAKEMEERKMNKIVVVFDVFSSDSGKELYEKLARSGYAVSLGGPIETCANASEEEIITQLYDYIGSATLVFGLSISGNGIAIYANKIRGITAAPVSNLEQALQAIELYGANVFDISANNSAAYEICKRVIESR